MTDIDRLEQRLSAVERVVVDGELSLDELEELTSLAETVSGLETRIAEQERRIADLEAAVQSIEGYVGNVESINDDVERQAASAVATVDRLERRVETVELELDEIQSGMLEDGEEMPMDESDPDGNETDDRTGGSDVDADGGETMDDADGGNTVDDESDEAVGFEFGTTTETETETTSEPAPEQSAAEIVADADESTPIVDDDTDRPGSSANQATIETALDGPADATSSTWDGDGDADGDTETDGGLLASLRSRF